MDWCGTEATCADPHKFSIIQSMYGEELSASICILHQQQSAWAEIFEINVCRMLLVDHYCDVLNVWRLCLWNVQFLMTWQQIFETNSFAEKQATMRL